MTGDATPVRLAKEAGLREQVAQKNDADISAEIASIRLFPEVAEALARLKKSGLKWGIISNFATPYAQPLLNLLPTAPDASIWFFSVATENLKREFITVPAQSLAFRPQIFSS